MQPRTASPNDQTTTRQAADAGADVANEAAGHARALSNSAGQQAGDLASHASEGAQEVARHARQQVGAVTGVAADQVSNLVDQARGEIQRTARERTDQVGGMLERFAGQMRALTEGRPEEAGPAADYLGQAVEATERFASRLRQGGPEAVLDDVTGFARRRPGVFLAGAALAGFGLGRLLRAGKDSGSLQSLTSSDGQTAPGGPAVSRPVPAPGTSVAGRPGSDADTGVIELREPIPPAGGPMTEPVLGAADTTAPDRVVAERGR